MMSLEVHAASYEVIFPDLNVYLSFHEKHRVGGANWHHGVAIAKSRPSKLSRTDNAVAYFYKTTSKWNKIWKIFGLITGVHII